MALAAACTGEGDETPTYHQDVAPLIATHCADCHSDGDIAPFPLTSFEEAKAVRELIRAAVVSREMPPWLAADGCTDYHGDRSLTEVEIDTLVRWVDAGAPQGDPTSSAAAVREVARPTLSQADLTLPMPEPYVPETSRPDDYRCFILDWPHDTDRFVTGFSAQPGNRALVHHVLAFLIPPDKLSRYVALDAADPGNGYTCFGGPGGTADPSVSWLGGWAPGGAGYDFPAGTGVRVTPGSKIILQLHYNVTAAAPAADQSSIQLRVAEAVETEAQLMPFANPLWPDGDRMLIPAGDEDVMHRFQFDPGGLFGYDDGFVIHTAAFHMHELGTHGRLQVARKGGDRECVLDVDRWDFRWQDTFFLERPITVNKHDELYIECHWDNSSRNQAFSLEGPRQPQDVRWGDGTGDEMCLSVFYVTPAN